MGKTSKATKKFVNKKLGKELDHRKAAKKHKQVVAKHKGVRKAKVTVQPGKRLAVDKSNPFDVGSDEEDEDIFDELDKMAGDDEEAGEEAEESDAGSDEDSKGEDVKVDEAEEEDEEDEEEDEDEDKEVDGEASDDEDGEAAEGEKVEVTMALVKKWEKELKEKPTLKIIKSIIQAFKSAVYLNELKDNSSLQSEYKFFVTKESVFNKLLFLTLKDLPATIQKMYPLQKKFNKKLNVEVRSVKPHKQLKQLSSVLKQHAISLITLLTDMSRTNLNLKIILLILSSIYDTFPFLISFRTLVKRLLNAMVDLWSSLNLASSSKDAESDQDEVNIDSFLDINVLTFSVILNLSKEYSTTILETVINSAYESFLKKSLTLPSSISLDNSQGDLVNYKKYKLIEFLKTGLSEIFKIDFNLTYQLAFKFIRKLSIHLRNYLKNSSNITNENDKLKTLKLIYNWQYIQSVEFWITFLSTVSEVKSMNELIYPVVQIALGTIKLNNSAIYFPLKFLILKSLIRLSASTTTYIPLFNIYIDLLHASIFNKSLLYPKKGVLSIQSNVFMSTSGIKVSKNSVNTAEYQLYLMNNFLATLQDYIELYCSNLAFPEFSFVINKKLKSYTKKNGSTNKRDRNMIFFIKELNLMVSKINENSKFVFTRREKLKSFDPIREPNLPNIEVSDLPFAKYVKTKHEILSQGDKLYKDLLVSEHMGGDSTDRKSTKQLESEQYFGKDKDVDMDEAESSSTESI